MSGERKILFSKGWTWTILAGAVLVVCLTSFAAEEKRDLVFEYYLDSPYPNYEECFWNAACVDFFLGGSREFHFPCSLYVQYDETECYSSNDSFQLDFKVKPYDGPGLELDLEAGLGFEIDLTVLYWDYQVGLDFEENFVPPLDGETRDFEDAFASLFGKARTCIGGAAIGLFTRQVLEGDAIAQLQLKITQPGNQDSVKFKDTGTIYTWLEFTHPGETVTKFLEIHPLFAGKIVIERRENVIPRFQFDQTFHNFLPGISLWVHKMPWNCSPWWKCHCFNHVDFIANWITGVPMAEWVELDTSESENIRYELWCDPSQLLRKKAQDLVAEVSRLSQDPYPHPELADTIMATIHNLYDTLCAAYDSINIEYCLAASESLVILDVNHVDQTDPRLAAFNSGAESTIVDTFLYDPANQNYIFYKEWCWDTLDAHPRYVVTIHPFVDQNALASCQGEGWTVASVAFDISSNDLATVAFEPPLPDFALDSIQISGPPYFEFDKLRLGFGELCTLCVRVRNRGVDWPIAGTPPHPADFVPLRMRILYEGGDIPLSQELYDVACVTPMAHDQDKTYCFDYGVLYHPFMDFNLPINLRFAFEVNGGNMPLDSMGWVVWEPSFENNALECEFLLTNLPDLAFPSDTLLALGATVDSATPSLSNVDPAYSCPQWRYLYVSDTSFLPGVPEPRVEIGTGPRHTSPRETTWVWDTCSWVMDFHDSDNKLYKVFAADGCLLQDLPDSFQRYCFRASLDWTHPDSPASYVYVDRDGVVPVDTTYDETPDDTLSQVNVYDFENAGLFSADYAICGNCNLDKNIGLGDVVCFINYLYRGFDPPEPQCVLDTNCDGVVNLGDVVYLISYLYRDGKQPCQRCC